MVERAHSHLPSLPSSCISTLSLPHVGGCLLCPRRLGLSGLQSQAGSRHLVFFLCLPTDLPQFPAPFVKAGQQTHKKEARGCTPCLSPKGPFGLSSLPSPHLPGPPHLGLLPSQSRALPRLERPPPLPPLTFLQLL